MRFIKKLQKIPSAIKKQLIVDKTCQQLCDHFSSNRKKVDGKTVILVQATEDPFYLGLFGIIAQSIQEQVNIKTHYYLMRSFNVGESSSVQNWVRARFFHNILQGKKWQKVYGTFCDDSSFSALRLNLLSDIPDYVRAKKIYSSITSKDDLVRLTIDNLLIGDLIYDTFLRFKPAPTVNIKDKYLLALIWYSLKLIRSSESYFTKIKPAIYLTSYTTYIQHGIPARVALTNNIKVLSFGNLQRLYKTLSISDSFHTHNTDNYNKDFLALQDQDLKLAAADAALQARLGGGVDAATAYMRNSAYKISTNDVPEVSGFVIIFLHDFYDSPHVYPDIVFPDFWEWICFTINALTELSIPFAIKPHPNQIALSDSALQFLHDKYPSLMILNAQITNRQLVTAGIQCAVTVHGTVAHEMAFMGVPTISCAHHPHNSFDFCHNAKTKEEYKKLLARAGSFPLDRNDMRQQSLKFYFMHNLNQSVDDRVMMDLVNKVRFASDDRGVNMLAIMMQLKDMPAYEKIENEVLALIKLNNE